TSFWELASGAAHRKHMVMTLSLPDTLKRFPEYLSISIIQAISLPGLFSALIGLFLLIRKHKLLGIVALWIGIAHSFYAVFLNQVSLEATPFGIPLLIVLCVGLAEFLDGLLKLIYSFHPLIEKLSAVFIMLLITMITISRVGISNRSHDDQAYLYGRMQQDVLPYRAALFVNGDDSLFIGAYLRNIEFIRPDIFWIDITGSIDNKIIPNISHFADQRAFLSYLSRVEDKYVELSGGQVFYTWLYDPEFIPVGVVYAPRTAIPEVIEMARALRNIYFTENDIPQNKDFQFRRTLAQIELMKAHDFIVNDKADNALQCIEQAVHWCRDSSAILTYSADLLRRLGHIHDAITLLEQAIIIEPSSEMAYFKLANLYTISGNSEKARKAQEQYIRLIQRYFN
ncbi:hypothetical protein JW979_12335, partial [bacterium]|nr:hypothetical protein [candidate division CSSED10-310 bacterium]